MPPDKGLTKVEKSGTKAHKTQLTFALTCNADGSDKLKPFIIGKSLRPACFNKKSAASFEYYYQNNAKAWMTHQLFSEWITQWDKNLQVEGRSIILLVDNFSGHSEPSDYKITSIRLEFFAPNLTSHVQPLDAGIIASWKCRYCSEFISYVIHRYESDVAIGLIYKINQLDAMERAQNSWYDISDTTISNCFPKSGIISPRRSDVLVDKSKPTQVNGLNLGTTQYIDPAAQQDLAEDLEELVSLKIVRKNNMMSISELLNPAEEHGCGLETWTPEEIFEEINQRNETDDINTLQIFEDEVPPRPSYSNMLKSADLLINYLRHEESEEAKSCVKVLC